ncbi:peptidylprolyl isomerase [Chitinolyticbacter albus]|uniref:peptidylprolyl isomerase n=1 Tax=Chitinolyticbacter albus TaxID=2961951 RepID=UPI00210AB192|nr:peptidylprolyl isomerase [Chitinolyticbacter albus]
MKWIVIAALLLAAGWYYANLDAGSPSQAQPSTVAATAAKPAVTPQASSATASNSAITVRCDTTRGPLDIAVKPEWSPKGAERFLQLVDDGHFNDMPLFRCVAGFLCQFGYKPGGRDYPTITDDTPGQAPLPFRQGYVSFAGGGANSRSSHLFITLGATVDALGKAAWETPIGTVTPDTLATVAQLNTEYGDMPPWGKGPDPARITAADGANYLKREFPRLDYIRSCRRG